MSSPVPVLEVGGTHVAAALVSPASWTVSGAVRLPVDADAPAADIVDAFVVAARSVDAPAGAAWGVAMPDPFDYGRGIGDFAGVAKFAALNGFDVGAALRSALSAPVAFLNDADAFALGEWRCGAGRDVPRLVGLTLGTGIGSGWVVDGRVVDPGVPRGGRIHHLTVDGAPLEDVVSRRAIRRAYAAAGGSRVADVREIAAAARSGEAVAARVLTEAFTALGRTAAPAIAGFDADAVVVGGSMTGSWDHIGPAFVAGLRDGGVGVLRQGAEPRIVVSGDAERSGFVGAAVHALRSVP